MRHIANKYAVMTLCLTFALMTLICIDLSIYTAENIFFSGNLWTLHNYYYYSFIYSASLLLLLLRLWLKWRCHSCQLLQGHCTIMAFGGDAL